MLSNPRLEYAFEQLDIAVLAMMANDTGKYAAEIAVALFAKVAYADDKHIVDGINIIKKGAPSLQVLTMEIIIFTIESRWQKVINEVLPVIEEALTAYGAEPYEPASDG